MSAGRERAKSEEFECGERQRRGACASRVDREGSVIARGKISERSPTSRFGSVCATPHRTPASLPALHSSMRENSATHRESEDSKGGNKARLWRSCGVMAGDEQVEMSSSAAAGNARANVRQVESVLLLLACLPWLTECCVSEDESRGASVPTMRANSAGRRRGRVRVAGCARVAVETCRLMSVESASRMSARRRGVGGRRRRSETGGARGETRRKARITLRRWQRSCFCTLASFAEQ